MSAYVYFMFRYNKMRRGKRKTWSPVVVNQMQDSDWAGAYYKSVVEAWRFTESLERHLCLRKAGLI